MKHMKRIFTFILLALSICLINNRTVYGALILNINNSGNATNRILNSTPQTDKEIIAFKISSDIADIAITSIQISLNYSGTSTDTDFTNAKLFNDISTIGTYESGEIQIGNTIAEPSSGILYFGSITGFTVYSNSSTNLLLILTHKSLTSGEGLQAFILEGWVKGETNSVLITNTTSITGTKKLVPSDLIVSNITNGDAGGYIFTSSAESLKEIFAFCISNNGSEDLTINNIYISLFYIGTATNTDFSFAKLYDDGGTLGTFDGPDTQIGSTINSFTNILRFTNNFVLSANTKKNLLITIDHSALTYGEGLKAKLFYNAIESTGNYTGTNIYSTNTFFSHTKKVPGGIFINNIASGDANLKYITKSAATDREILCFRISATTGERIVVNRIKVSLAYTNGATDADFTNARITYDSGAIGTYAAEPIITTVTNPLNGILIFSNITGFTLNENWATNLLLIIDKYTTGAGEGLRPYILAGWIKGTGLDTKTNITSSSNAIGILKIGSTVIHLTNQDIGDASDNYLTKSSENDKEIICIKISCDKGESWCATTMKFSLIYSGGASSNDFTNAKLYADSGNIGTFDGTETQLGDAITNIPATKLIFSITGFTLQPNKSTNVLLVIAHKNMTPGEAVKAQVLAGTAGFTGSGTYTGLTISGTGTHTGSIKQVPADIYTSILSNGDSALTSLTKSSENYHELISFKLSATVSEDVAINRVRISLAYFNGASDSDITNCRLFIDKNSDGTYDAGDTLLLTLNQPSSGIIDFTGITGFTLFENSTTNLLVTIAHSVMSSGAGIQAYIKTNDVTGVGIITGYTNSSYGSGNGVLKRVPSDLIVQNINTGNVASTYINKSSEINKEIICFKLSATAGESIILSSIKISLFYQGGFSDTDVTNARIYFDTGTLGTYDGTETQIGSTISEPTGGILNFTGLSGITIFESKSTNILLIIEHSSLNNGYKIQGVVEQGFITGGGDYTLDTITSISNAYATTKQVGNEIFVSFVSNGDSINKSLTKGAETYHELIAFKLSAGAGEDMVVTRVKISLNYTNSATDTDFTNFRLFIDSGIYGTYEGVDTAIGSIVNEPSAGKVVFTGITGLTVPENSIKNLLITFQHPALSPGSGIRGVVGTNYIKAWGIVTSQTDYSAGAFSGVLKKVPADLIIKNNNESDCALKVLSSSAESDVEIISVHLSASIGENISINQIEISLDYYGGTDVTNFRNSYIYEDVATIGKWLLGIDTTLLGSVYWFTNRILITGISGFVIPENSSKDIILKLDHIELGTGEGIRARIMTGKITGTGEYTSETITSLSNVFGTPKRVPSLIVTGLTQGDAAQTTLTKNNENYRETIVFNLSAGEGETLQIREIKLSLIYNDGAVDTDFTNARLFIDLGTTGTYDASDVQIGNTIIEPSSGLLLFTNITGFSLQQYQSTNILLTIGHIAMDSGEGIYATLKSNWITVVYSPSGITNYSIGSATGNKKEVPGTLTILSSVLSGDVGMKYLLKSPENYKEIIGFELSASRGEDIIIQQIKISLNYGNGASDTDFTNARLFVDLGTTGTYDGADNQYGITISQPSSGVITFSSITGLTLRELQTTNILITIDHKSMTSGESVKPYLNIGWINASGDYTANAITSVSSATGVTKTVGGDLYVSLYTQGDISIRSLTKNTENYHELLGIKLSASSGEDLIINKVQISLNYYNSAANSDFTNYRLFIDTGTIGTYEGIDTQIGNTVDDTISGFIEFNNISGLTVNAGGVKYLLLTVQHPVLASGKGIQAQVFSSNIKFYGKASVLTNYSSGSGSGFIKKVHSEIYITLNNVNDVAKSSLLSSDEYDIEIIAFSISVGTGEDVTINDINITLNYLGGVDPTNFYNARIFRDIGTIGNYVFAQEGVAGAIDTDALFTNVIQFTGLNYVISENTKTNFIVIIDHYALQSGDGITPWIKAGGITGTGNYTGGIITNTTSITGATKIVGGEIYITNVNTGDVMETTLTSGAENNREILLLRISANSAEDMVIQRLKVSLAYNDGAVDSDFTNIRLYYDTGAAGNYDGTETQIGSTITEPSSGIVIFSNITGFTVTAGNATNVLIVAGHIGMESGEGVTAIVLNGWAEGVGVVSGVTDTSDGTANGIRKEVPGTLYVANVSNGELLKKYLYKIGETNREIIGLKLSASVGEDITLASVKISLDYGNGATDTDFTNVKLFIDTGTIGTYETGIDTTLVGSVSQPSSGVVLFNGITGITIPESSVKYLLMILDYKTLNIGESIKGIISESNITAGGVYTIEQIKSTGNYEGIIKIVPNEITVKLNPAGDANTEKSLTYSSETYKEIIAFRISAESGEKVAIKNIKISLAYTNSATDTDFTNAELYIDISSIGTYDGTDIQIGSTVIQPSSGTVEFTGINGLTVKQDSVTNLLLVISHKAMEYGEGVKGIIYSNYVKGIGATSSYTTYSKGEEQGLTKIVPNKLIINNFTSGDAGDNWLLSSWETNKEIIAFTLSSFSGERVRITSIAISLDYVGGAIDSDFTNASLFLDRINKGTYDASDVQIGATITQPSAGILTFGSITGFTLEPEKFTNILLVIWHKNMSVGEGVTGIVKDGWIKGEGLYTSEAITSLSNIQGITKTVKSISIYVSLNQAGDAYTEKSLTKSVVDNCETIALKLSADFDEDVIITRLKISLNYTNGATDTDFTNARLYIDLGTTGTYDSSDIVVESNVTPSSGAVIFSNISGLTVSPNSTTNVLIVIKHYQMDVGEGIMPIVLTNWVEGKGVDSGISDLSSGSATNILKIVPDDIILSNNDTGDAALKILNASGGNDIEIISFKISANGVEDIAINSISFSLEFIGGAVATDFNSAQIYIDKSTIGTFDGVGVDEYLAFSAAVTTNLTFNGITGLTVKASSATNVILIMDHGTLNSGEGIKAYINYNKVSGTGLYTADSISSITATTGAPKIVPGELYISHCSNGDAIIKSLTKSSEINHELICIKLSANNAETLIINKIGLSLDYTGGAADTDFTNARIFIDNGTYGTYESALDVFIDSTNISNSKLIFENISGLTVVSNNVKYLLLVTEHKKMSSGEGVKAIALTNQFEYIGFISDYTGNAFGSAEGVLKKVPGSLIISSISNGDVADTSFTLTPESQREILSLQISATAGENITLNTIKISLLYGNGADDTQITNIKLFIDNSIIGTYETGIDTVLLGTLTKPTNNLLSFTNISGLTISELSSKYILLIFDHKSMPITAYLKPVVKSNYIVGTGLYTVETITSTTTITGIIKQVSGAGEIYVTINSNGDSVNEKYLTKSAESIKEIIAFRLSATPIEKRKILSIAISLSYNGTATDTDFTNARLYYDTGTIGTYDTETSSQLISSVSNPTGTGWIVFDNISGLTINSNLGTNFIVILGHKSLTPNEGFITYIKDGAVESVGIDSNITNTSFSNGNGILKKVPSDLYVFNINAGNASNPSLRTSYEYDKEIICLRLSATSGDRLAITSLQISLNYGSGATDTDFTNARLFVDKGTTGTYDGGTDTFISSVVAQPSSGWLNFGGISGITLNENGATNFLLVLDHKTMQPDESVQAIVPAGYVQSVGEYTGYPVTNITSATGITKIVGGNVVVSIYTQNELYIKHLTSSPQTNIEILGLHLSAASAEDLIVNQIKLSLSYQGTASDSDFTNLALYIDLGTTGSYDASDIQIGNIIAEPSTGIVLFDNITGFTITAYSATNILFVAGHNILNCGEGLQGIIFTNWIKSIGVNSGGTNYSFGEGSGNAKEVPGRLFIYPVTNGDTGSKILSMNLENNVEMLQIRLSSEQGENKIVNSISLSLYSANSSINASDLTNARIYLDAGTSGTYDASDVLVSSTVSQPASLMIQFSNISGLTVFDGKATNLLVVVGHKSLSYGDRIEAIVLSNWIEYYGSDTEYTNNSIGNDAYGVEKRVPGKIWVSIYSNGDLGNHLLTKAAENNVEIIGLRLSASKGEDVIVERIKITLIYTNGSTDSDFTNARLYIDIDNDGVYDTGSDINIGGTIVMPSSKILIFSNISGFTVNENNTTNIMLVMGHKLMSSGEGVKGYISDGWVTSIGNYTGVTNTSTGSGAGVLKMVPATLIIFNNPYGDANKTSLTVAPENNVEIISAKISNTGPERVKIDSITISLNYIGTSTNTDWTADFAKLFIDMPIIGNWVSSTDSVQLDGNLSMTSYTNELPFTGITGLTIEPNSVTNVILIMSHNTLTDGEGIRARVMAGGVVGTGLFTGGTVTSISNAYGTNHIVTGQLQVTSYTQGDAHLTTLTKSAEPNREIISFKLSAIGEDMVLTKVKITLIYNDGAVDSDFTNARLYLDAGTKGTYDASDTQIGTPISKPISGMLEFTNITGYTLDMWTATNILLVIGHTKMQAGEGVYAVVKSNYVVGFGNISGVTDWSEGEASEIKKEVPSDLFVINNLTGKSTNRFLTAVPETNKEIIAFKLSVSTGENVKINRINISLDLTGGASETDFTNARLFYDLGTIGTYDASDISINSATYVLTNNMLWFTNITGFTIPETKFTNILLVIEHKQMTPGEGIRALIRDADITAIGDYTKDTITSYSNITGIKKEVPGLLTISGYTQGDVGIYYLASTPDTNKEIIGFVLSASVGESIVINSIKLSLAYFENANDSFFTNARLYIDTTTYGTYDASDSAINAPATKPTNGILNFNNITGFTLNENSTTNILLVLDHYQLQPGDRVQGIIKEDWVTGKGIDSGVIITSFSNHYAHTKTVPGFLKVYHNNAGDVMDKWLTLTGETTKEIVALKLSAIGEPVIINNINISLDYEYGFADSDFVANSALVLKENGTIGTYVPAVDLPLYDSATVSGGIIPFVTSFTIPKDNFIDVIVVIDYNAISNGYSFNPYILTNQIRGTGEYSAITNIYNTTIITGIHKEAKGTIYVTGITQGDYALRYLTREPETNKEIFGIRLSAGLKEDIVVNSIKISLSYFDGASDSDFTNGMLFVDVGTAGTYETGTDIKLLGTVAKPSSGILDFTGITGFTISELSATNILLIITHKQMASGEGITPVILSNWIIGAGIESTLSISNLNTANTGVSKEVEGIIYISCITQGKSADRFFLKTPETNKEMMLIKLSASYGESKVITRIKLSLDYINGGITDTDITNLALYYDLGTAGTYDASDILIASFTGHPNSGIVVFSNITGFTLNAQSTTNILFVLQHKSLTNGDRARAIVLDDWIESYGLDTLYTNTSDNNVTNVTKIVPAGIFVSVITNGDSAIRYILQSAETNIEILQLKLSSEPGEDAIVSRIKISLYSDGGGIVNTDLTNFRAFLDSGTSGTYDFSDIAISEIASQPAASMTVVFTNITGLTVPESGTTNILIVFGHKSLNVGDRIQAIVSNGWIESYGAYSKYTNTDQGPGGAGVIKEVPGILYVSSITQGDSGLKYISATPETNIELMQVKLSAGFGEDKIITRIRLSLATSGITASDLTNIAVYLDAGVLGTYEAADILVSETNQQPTALVFDFTNISGLTVFEQQSTNILVVFGHKNLNYGDNIQGFVKGIGIQHYGNYTIYTDTGIGNSTSIIKEVPGELFVTPITNGDSALSYIKSTPESNVELIQIKLSATFGEDKVVNRIRLSLFSPSGTITDTDITNLRIYLDLGISGTYDSPDIAISSNVSEPSGMIVLFSNITGLTVSENSSTNILIVFGHNSLGYGDNIQGIIQPSFLEYYGTYTLFTNTSQSSNAYGVVKEVPGEIFVIPVTNGNSALKYLAKSAEADKEIMLFRISASSGEDKIISAINISLEYYNGISDANLSNPEVYFDVNNNGSFDNSIDTFIATAPNPVSGVVSFSSITGITIPENSATNILFILDHNTLNVNYGIRSKIKTNDITAIGIDTDYTNYSVNSAYGIYKEVPGELYVSVNSNGDALDRFLLPTYESNKEIISFKLSNTAGEDKILQKLVISLEYNGGATDTDFTNAKIYIDNTVIGTYTAADIPLLGADLQPSSGKLYFTNITGFTIRENNVTNIILIIDDKNMTSGEGVKAYFIPQFIQFAGITTEFTNYLGTNTVVFGSAIGVKKEVPGELYVFNNSAGDSAATALLSSPEINREIISLKISASVGENITLNRIMISLDYGGTFNDNNVTNARIYLDSATIGTYDGTEKLIDSTPEPVSAKLIFSNITGLTIQEASYTNILLVVEHNTLNPGSSINAVILTNWISGGGVETVYPISNQTVATGIRKYVASVVIASVITQGDVTDYQLNGQGMTNKEIFAFTLTNYGENVVVSNIRFNIIYGNGATSSDFSNMVLLFDYGTIGTYDASDVAVGTNTTFGNFAQFTFTSGFTLYNNSTTNFLIIIDNGQMNVNEYIQIYLYNTNFKGMGINSKATINLENSTNSVKYYVKVELIENTNNISDAFVQDGQTNVPALKFTLSASESEPVRIPSIKIEGLLNTSEVTNLTLIIDINNNGVKDTSDIIYDKNKSFFTQAGNTYALFTNSGFILNADSSTNFLVLYNFINNISPTTQYRCRILRNYVTVTGVNSGSAIPVASVSSYTGVLLTAAWGQITFSEGPVNDIAVPNNGLVVDSEPDIEIMQFRIAAAPMEDVIVHWIMFSNSGKAPDSAITNVLLLMDNNRNGTNDGADTLVSSGIFNNNLLKLNLNITNTAGSNIDFIVVYQLAVPISNGFTFQVTIVDASNTGVESLHTVTNIGLPLTGNLLLKGMNSAVIWRNKGGTVSFTTSDLTFTVDIPPFSIPISDYAVVTVTFLNTTTSLINIANSKLPSNISTVPGAIFKIDAYDKNTSDIMGDTNGDGIQDLIFDGDVTVKYSDFSTTFKNNVDLRKLRIFYLNPISQQWEIVPNSTIDKDLNEVVAHITHFSIYSLMEVTPTENLGDIFAYPNPYSPFKYTVTSRDFPGENIVKVQYELKQDCEIDVKIFNLVGDLVYSKHYDKGVPQISAGGYSPTWIEWNGKNNDGRYVSDGGYILQITAKPDSGKIEKKYVKILVIKDR